VIPRGAPIFFPDPYDGDKLERVIAPLPATVASQDDAAAVPPPDVPPTPDDPSQSPGEGWEWKGKQPPGLAPGNWVNESTGEKLNPDLNHGPPIGPHWDYVDPKGNEWRVFSDGRIELKTRGRRQ
jgi:Bacterial toxin 37